MALISVEEALARVLGAVEPLEAERTSLLDAVGRVLREDIVATRALPPWDNSAVDGYAVRAADLAQPGATLPVSDEIAAGDPGDRPLSPGTAARIFTGAPLPPGADAVVMQEDTARDGDRVTFATAAEPGRHVRLRGSDVRPGQRVLSAGRVLRPGDVGLLATLGRSAVAVGRAPVVAILSSGDELVEADAGEPGPGRIVNGNALALAAAVLEAGGRPRVHPIVPDDPVATRAALAAGLRADVLVSSGGVSVGAYDFVGQALVELCGSGFGFWKVAIKPGKPLAFGRAGACVVFGLPGNPASALVTFELFARPALLRMAGHDRVLRRPVAVVLAAPLPAGGARQEYLRAALHAGPGGTLVADARRAQSSGALSSLGGADALLVIPPGAPPRAAGETAPAIVLGPDDPALRDRFIVDR